MGEGTAITASIAIARIGWLVFIISFVSWECYWLGKGILQGTFSYQWWLIRYDPFGRWVILPFSCWMFGHLNTAPKWLMVRADWRSFVWLTIGFIWAGLETWAHK